MLTPLVLDTLISMEYEPLITWDMPEYYHTDKTADWYWTLGIIAISIAVLCVLFGDVLLALFAILGALTLGIYAHREPNIVPHEISTKGVLVDKTLYTFNSLESFWIESDEPRPKIVLKSKKMFMPYILIPCEGLPLNEVRKVLLAHLPEVEHHEPLTQKLFEHFGF